MVRGLNVFRERFAGFQDRYALSGGAALVVAMDAAAFARAFWAVVILENGCYWV